jgi:hypothetical protein
MDEERFKPVADELYELYKTFLESGFEKDQAFDLTARAFESHLARRKVSKAEILERCKRINAARKIANDYR